MFVYHYHRKCTYCRRNQIPEIRATCNGLTPFEEPNTEDHTVKDRYTLVKSLRDWKQNYFVLLLLKLTSCSLQMPVHLWSEAINEHNATTCLSWINFDTSEMDTPCKIQEISLDVSIAYLCKVSNKHMKSTMPVIHAALVAPSGCFYKKQLQGLHPDTHIPQI